jgi:ATP-binding cassette subfamily B protein
MKRKYNLIGKFLVESFKQSKVKSIICCLVMLMLTLLCLFLPIILQRIIDVAIGGKNVNALFLYGGMYMAIMISIAILNMNQQYNLSYLKTKMTIRYKYLLLRKLSTFSGAYYSEQKSGEVLNIIDNDTDIVENYGIDLVFDFVRNIITSIFALTMLIHLQSTILCIIIGIQIITIIVQSKFSKVLADKTVEVREQAGKVYNIIEQYISNILEIVILKARRYFLIHYLENEGEFARKGIRLDVLFSVSSQSATFLSSMITILVYIIGGMEIIKGNLQVGELIEFQQYTAMFIGPCMGLLKINESIQRLCVSLDRIYSFLKFDNRIVQDNKAFRFPDYVSEISLTHVNFGYGNDKVLKNINYTFRPGKVYAIVGTTGCGKSTIINLLYRLWDVDSGEITVNGKNVKEYNLCSLRKSIAVVSQNTFLFDDTIENNLTLNNSKIKQKDYVAVCKQIGIDEFISKLPKGYQTQVGENGVKLSGGQRQRIAIVRMILQSKDILIFDEATSALDNITQEYILDNLRQYYKNKIVIMIAHRLSTIKKADEILVLNNGEIVEVGDHELLMKKKQYYYQLVEERSA